MAERIVACRVCGNEFTVRRKGFYCSGPCKEVVQKRRGREGKRAMRKKAATASRKALEKATQPKSTCVFCGIDIVGKHKKARLCSRECNTKFRRTLRTKVNITVPCSFCGSVKIIADGKAIKKYLEIGRAFCDNECATPWRADYYKSDEYRQKVDWYRGNLKKQTAESDLERKAENDRKKENSRKKNFRCCSWCFKAFSRSEESIACSQQCESRINHIRKSAVKPTLKTCEYCEKQWLAGTIRSRRKKFCSRRCAIKATKDRRIFWSRSNGPCEYIDLSKLVKKHKSKCCECSVKVTRYNGTHRNSDASIDHIMPLSKGGWHCWSNVQLLCMLCNSLKSDSVPNDTQMLLELREKRQNWKSLFV